MGSRLHSVGSFTLSRNLATRLLASPLLVGAYTLDKACGKVYSRVKS